MKRSKSKAPAMLHNDFNVAMRVIRDSFTEEVDRVLIDDAKLYQEVLAFVRVFAPQLQNRIRQDRGPRSSNHSP